MSTVILFTFSYFVCFAVRRVGNVITLRMCLRVVCAEYNLWLLSSCTFLTSKKYLNSAEVKVNSKKPRKCGIFFTASVCIHTKSVWATVHYT
jgi:hypothetical protein